MQYVFVSETKNSVQGLVCSFGVSLSVVVVRSGQYKCVSVCVVAVFRADEVRIVVCLEVKCVV